MMSTCRQLKKQGVSEPPYDDIASSEVALKVKRTEPRLVLSFLMP